MATTPRNIRFDDDLYKEMHSIAKRPMTAAYHIQEACRQYLEQFDTPVVKAPESKGISPVPIKGGWVEGDRLFELFWAAGMRKVNKKKAKPLFLALIKKATPTYEQGYTAKLVADIHARLASNQLGFSEMHPTTYLNGERWNDEVTPNGQNNQSGRDASGHRLSAVERVAAKSEANRAARASDRHNMEDVGGDLRQHDSLGFRGRDAGGMDSIIEGDYTQSDS